MMTERQERQIRVKIRGKTLNVVRELYLRNEIPCRSPLCEKCLGGDKQINLLPSDVTHYLVPFPDVVLNYLEILEFPEIRGIIFPQTVAQMVQQEGGKRLYTKLSDLIRVQRKKCALFTNEFCQQTYCPRKEGESLKSWQLRNTYSVATWYYLHLAEKIPVVMVTEDIEVLKMYQDETPGVLLITLNNYLKEFFTDLRSAYDIYESLNALLTMGSPSDVAADYEAYLPTEILETGRKAGRYHQGLLKVNEFNSREEAFVIFHSLDKQTTETRDILITGMKNRNRAIHGDIVVVELLPKTVWQGRSQALRIPEEKNNADDPYSPADAIMPTGRVVGIAQRRWRDYVVSLPQEENFSANPTQDRILAIPYDYRIPKIRILTRQATSLKDDRIVVRIDSWETNSQYPNGHFVRSLGRIGDMQTEAMVLLVENGISITSSAAVLQELPINTPEKPWKMEPSEIARRRDLRETHLICSIDPKGCEDVDDAVSIRSLTNGHFEVGVHIADVTHFVPFNSLTDQEARARGTTFYMTEQRYDMLPRVLSADLCSLKGNVDRYAVSVLWTVDEKCNITDVWYGRTIIKSSYKLFYEGAQEIIDTDCGISDALLSKIPELQHLPSNELSQRLEQLRTALRQLTELGHILKERRSQGGALELESNEVLFEFEEKKDRIEDIKPKKELVIHETVAEFMIFANCWVARKIIEMFPGHALLRNHPSPCKENFTNLLLCAEAKNFHIDISSNKQLAMSLDSCVDANDPYVNKIMRNLTVQAMSQALYFSTGSVPPEQCYHYGLATSFYTHFTSPIRRYADIMVHRLMLAIVDDQRDSPGILSNTALRDLCEHINGQTRAAKVSQKASEKLFQALFFDSLRSDDRRKVSDAIIFSIRVNGVLVFLPTYGIKGPIYLRNKSQQVVYVSPKSGAEWMNGSIIKERLQITVTTALGSQVYRLFDHITVFIDVEKPHAHAPSIKLTLINNQPHPEWKAGIEEQKYTPEHLMQELQKQSTSKSEELTKCIVQNKHKKESLYSIIEELRKLSLIANE